MKNCPCLLKVLYTVVSLILTIARCRGYFSNKNIFWKNFKMENINQKPMATFFPIWLENLFLISQLFTKLSEHADSIWAYMG